MLDKIDRRYFAGSEAGLLASSIQGTLYQYGIHSQQIGPSSWSARGTHGAWSLVPKVGFSIAPVQGGLAVDVRVSPDIETNGIIILVVAWVFFFPVAIVLGLLAYQDWERRSAEIMNAIWAPLASKMIAPQAPAWGVPPAPAPPPPAGFGGPR